MATFIEDPAYRFESLYGDVKLPKYHKTPTIPSLIIERSKQYGDKPLFIDGVSGKCIRYNEVEQLIRKFGAGLTARGFKKGDILALYTRNNIEWGIVFQSVMSIGGIVTTCNPAYTARELAHQLKDSGANWMMTQAEFLDKTDEAAKHLNLKHPVLLFDASPAGRNLVTYEQLVDNDASGYPEVNVSPDDVMCIPYSSGTSGVPKGVMLQHRTVMANLFQISHLKCNDINRNDTLIGFLPFYHIYGMVIIQCLGTMHGATTVVMPQFDLELFCQHVQNYQVSVAHLVPPIVLLLAKSPIVSKYDLSSLREILSGAAPLGVELAEEVVKRIGVDRLRQGYGMTELGTVCHLDPIGDIHNFGAAGKVIPNTEMLIVDPETNQSLGLEYNPETKRRETKRGEVWIRGPQVMKGYLNRPDATANTIDKTGFLHTGDIGIVDQDGYLYVVDRLKELIKFRGLQVAPAELEALLLTHPGVADAAVIGVDVDGTGDELPKGFIVRKPESTVSAKEIQDFVAELVSAHKKIRLVEFLEEIPKSGSGKILRRELRDREREKMRKMAKL